MIFVLSHNDLDGYGCVLTALKMKDSVSYINTGYDKITTSLNDINTVYMKNISKLFITDLNFNESDTIELYKIVKHNSNVEIIYIDHHHYASEKQNKIFEKMKEFSNFKFIHTDKFCATYIFYKYLLKQELIEFNEDFDKIIKLINAFDTWNEQDQLFKSGMFLNDIFNEWKDKEQFLDYFITNGKITDEIKNEMKDLVKRKNELFNRLETSGFIVPMGDILLFMSDAFISHMTIDYPQYKYYINGRSWGSISIRLKDIDNPLEVKDSIIKLLEHNQYVMSLGGHPNAMGVTLYPEHKDKMVQIIEIIIKHIAITFSTK